MATLSAFLSDIQVILQDAAYTEAILIVKINDALASIAGGIRMPDGLISPPIPDLYTYSTVDTTSNAYVAMPTTYQRNLFKVVDDTGNTIAHPRGGDYSSFALFVNQASDKTLAETGSVYRVCLKGRNLYYQGIPTAEETLGLHFYKKPTELSADTDEPDFLPSHLQKALVKHYVCKEIFGEQLEDGQDNKGVGVKYHSAKFYEAMVDLIDCIGIDAMPEYYGEDNFYDAGMVD